MRAHLISWQLVVNSQNGVTAHWHREWIFEPKWDGWRTIFFLKTVRRVSSRVDAKPTPSGYILNPDEGDAIGKNLIKSAPPEAR